MRIQYKHQKFQADAAKAVVDVFAGQPYMTPNYMVDTGANSDRYGMLTRSRLLPGWKAAPMAIT